MSTTLIIRDDKGEQVSLPHPAEMSAMLQGLLMAIARADDSFNEEGALTAVELAKKLKSVTQAGGRGATGSPTMNASVQSHAEALRNQYRQCQERRTHNTEENAQTLHAVFQMLPSQEGVPVAASQADGRIVIGPCPDGNGVCITAAGSGSGSAAGSAARSGSAAATVGQQLAMTREAEQATRQELAVRELSRRHSEELRRPTTSPECIRVMAKVLRGLFLRAHTSRHRTVELLQEMLQHARMYHLDAEYIQFLASKLEAHTEQVRIQLQADQEVWSTVSNWVQVHCPEAAREFRAA